MVGILLHGYDANDEVTTALCLAVLPNSLDKFVKKYSFKAELVRVDDESEFIKDFERALQAIPPRNPELNDDVERIN